jgi:tetratricopeptide (TPR) repeat protein
MMAWVYYKRNEIDKALPHIEKALRTGSVNPVLLSTAGLIYFKSGNKEKGKEFLKKALLNNPVMPLALIKESKSVLTQH